MRALLAALMIAQTPDVCVDQQVNEWVLGESDAGRSLVDIDHAFIVKEDGGVTIVTQGAWLSNDALIATGKELADRRARDTLYESDGSTSVSVWVPVLALAGGILLGTAIGYGLTQFRR